MIVEVIYALKGVSGDKRYYNTRISDTALDRSAKTTQKVWKLHPCCDHCLGYVKNQFIRKDELVVEIWLDNNVLGVLGIEIDQILIKPSYILWEGSVRVVDYFFISEKVPPITKRHYKTNHDKVHREYVIGRGLFTPKVLEP